MDISSLASSLDAISASLPLLGTELALTALLLVVLVVHLSTRRRWPAFTGYFTIVGLLIVTVFWFSQTLGLDSYTLSARPWALMGGALELDRWAQWFKGLVLVGTLVGVLLTRSEARPVAGETYFLLVALALGGVLMAGASHGLIVYLGIELASLASYVLVALSKGDTLSERLRAEAATKYIVYGAVSSALMLYGLSLVYGLTGTLQLGSGLALRLADADPAAATVAVSFVLIGLAYKLSAAPMHFWSPDVYEAAPGGVVAALATTSKLAALAIVLRLADSVATVPTWPLLVAGLALLSLTVGSLGALAQRDAKRLLAYGGVAQAGYLLMGLAVGGAGGERAVLVYSLVYALLTLLAFGAGAAFASRAEGSWQLDRWQGLGRRYPVAGVAMAVAMAGLVGLPPTAGFIGKLAVFLPLAEAVQQLGLSSVMGVVVLIVLGAGLIYSVLSLFFYLKVAARLFLEADTDADVPTQALGPRWNLPLALGSALALMLGTVGVNWLLG